MAGIYIHIPFCKSRCIYCDFFSTTLLSKRDEYVNALCQELSARQSYLKGESVGTIYFGGGTPSVLSPTQIKSLLTTINTLYNVEAGAEITLEANPKDLNIDNLHELHRIGINRLSIGIQSFDDNMLKLISRRHNGNEAIEAVQIAKTAGFENLSIDLMYGLPQQSLEQWQATIDKAISLNVEHISAYNLTVEDGTALQKMLEKGDITLPDEEQCNAMYELLINKLKEAGYIHYEVSNFCKKGYHSRHNSNYWNMTPYLGIGAGAHSYDGNSRQWNISNIEKYISGAKAETEVLSNIDKYNELIMLGLRTSQGINLNQLNDAEKQYCIDKAQKYISSNMLTISNQHLLLTNIKAVEIMNGIIVDLMK